jgi:hypothetical protein
MGGVGLGIALVIGATAMFNILAFAVFTVLWLAFATALALSPRTLDAVWQAVRELPLIVQGVVWLLFLPLVIGLWIWERSWSLPIRLTLIVALGAWNIFMFLPQG